MRGSGIRFTDLRKTGRLWDRDTLVNYLGTALSNSQYVVRSFSDKLSTRTSMLLFMLFVLSVLLDVGGSMRGSRTVSSFLNKKNKKNGWRLVIMVQVHRYLTPVSY